jgi:PilZ domain
VAKIDAIPVAGEERRSVRSSVMLAAIIDAEGARLPVRVVNLSAHGALVQADDLPRDDMTVTFRCGGLEVGGWMAWVRPPLAGVNFDMRVDPNAALQTIRAAHMVVADTRGKDFRRPGFRGKQLSKEERQILENWGREQEGLARK